jgi:hypothetical protein
MFVIILRRNRVIALASQAFFILLCYLLMALGKYDEIQKSGYDSVIVCYCRRF